MSEPDELTFTPFQKSIVRLAEATPAPGKHIVRSAVRHIIKAWRIRNIDKEMAGFRRITGEEESVSAIFHALVRRKYDGAEQIKKNKNNHNYKWALVPFFEAVGDVLAEVQEQLRPAVVVEEYKGKELARLRIKLDEQMAACPVPPLHISMQINGKFPDYANELNKIAKTEKNLKNVRKYVEQLANQRNLLLYAWPSGVPEVQHPLNNHLERGRDMIVRNLIVYLMIDPYAEKQLFVQECLNAFLKMMERLPDKK